MFNFARKDGQKIQDRPGRRTERDETGRRMTGKNPSPVAACCKSWMSVAISNQYFSQPWKTMATHHRRGSTFSQPGFFFLSTSEMGDNMIGWAKTRATRNTERKSWDRNDKTGQNPLWCKKGYLSRFLTKFTLNHENTICWPWQPIAEGGSPSSDHSLAF